MLKKPFVRYTLVLTAIAALVIGLDQYTKYIVRRDLPLHSVAVPIPWLEPLLVFTHTRNTGAAFGILPGLSPVFTLVAFVAVLVITVYYHRLAGTSWMLRIAFGLMLGGAISNNLIERPLLGYVTDFIDIHFWPVFNVADSAITVGTILLAVYALFLDRERQPTEQRRTDCTALDAGDSSSA